MTVSAISARGLVKTFGEGATAVTAVRGVDLDVARGEVVLIMGPSGSGKTTLLSMLGAMLRPSSGALLVDGVDVAATSERHLPGIRSRLFGFIFQDFNLLSTLSALENVEFACNLGGVTGRMARAKAAGLLERFELGNRLHFHTNQLSGGEKQRVAIARALANDPPILLADEPTANLDSRMGHQIGRLLRSLAVEDNRGVVIVSHDSRLKEIADRVLWLEDGAFSQIGSMATDPVCGMTVEQAGPHYVIAGATYWFCSEACRDDFAARPDHFTSPR